MAAPTAHRVLEAAGAFQESRLLHTALELGVFDALGDRARTAAALARRGGTDPRTTAILLDALTALGWLRKRQGRYRNAAAARRHLVAGSPDYLGDMVRLTVGDWEAWGRLAHTVRTGRPARRPDMYQHAPRRLKDFIRAMDNLAVARGDAAHLARTLDLAGRRRLLDVGGGPGTYSIHFLRRHPNLTGVIFDLPNTLKLTRRFVREAGLARRLRLAAGDFNRDPLPPGFDTVFLSNILHGASARDCRRLLKRIARSLEPGGRLIIKEHVLGPDRTRPLNAATFAVTMALLTRGQCYTWAETRDWLRAAGFRKIRHHPPRPPLTVSLVTAEKP